MRHALAAHYASLWGELPRWFEAAGLVFGDWFHTAAHERLIAGFQLR